MAIKYGFFNSVDGDRKYDADDIGNYFLKLISDGVFATPATAMQVTAVSGLKVSVAAGWGFIKCKYLNNTAALQLTLSAADVVLNRIDRIVMRLDTTNRLMTIAVKQGTAASTPTAPALTRVTGGVWELSLAQIYVGAGVTTITQANITDERADTSLCGYVTGLIDQIDTTNLFAQFTAAFNEWFDDVKESVVSTTILAQYRNTYTTPSDAAVSTIAIGISQYNSALDVLNVYINGFRLVNGVDYTESNGLITLTNALDTEGTVVEFECLKSIDGAEAESIQAEVIILHNNLGNFKFRKMTQTDYDNLPTKDNDTVYYTDDDGEISQYLGSKQVSGGGSTATSELLSVPIVGGDIDDTITLNDDMSNYDALIFEVGVTASSKKQFFTTQILTSQIYNTTGAAAIVGGSICSSNTYSVWYMLEYVNATTLKISALGQSTWIEAGTIFSIKGKNF